MTMLLGMVQEKLIFGLKPTYKVFGVGPQRGGEGGEGGGGSTSLGLSCQHKILDMLKGSAGSHTDVPSTASESRRSGRIIKHLQGFLTKKRVNQQP